MAATRRFASPQYPAWIREIDLALPVKAQFLVTGNLRDSHLLPLDDPRSPGLVDTVGVITDCLVESGYDLVLVYDPVDGVRVAHQAEGAQGAAVLSRVQGGSATAVTLTLLTDILKEVVQDQQHRVAIVLDYASRLHVDDQNAGPELQALLTAAEKLAHTAQPHAGPATRPTMMYNSVFWLVDRELDLPHWLSSIEAVRVVSIPVPTLGTRALAAERLAISLPGFSDLPPDDQSAVTTRFAELTQGMTLRSMRDVTVLAVDGGVAAARIEEAVRSYRVGSLDNPWQEPSLKGRIRAGTETLGRRVLGQPRALSKSLDILVRSAMGLTGAQSGGHPGRPQGILFFAGPTGVGKTELAKSLAEVLFGTEDAYTRFDMSEFSQEQSEARLIGAPPGYIGHDSGGELTNAVRQKPFSILLFDEVEKAHPRILDKFLQILEDGRLTDGSGSTVYFSETVIVFTSNLGIYGTDDSGERVALVTADEPFDDIERKVREAIDDHFTRELQRPELLNRIGDNIIVFDFISPEIGRQLVDKYLANVVAKVKAQLGVDVSIAPDVVERVAETALGNLPFGGRGIGSVIETTFVNPLARALFEHDVTGSATVVGLEKSSGPAQDGPEWQVTLS